MNHERIRNLRLQGLSMLCLSIFIYSPASAAEKAHEVTAFGGAEGEVPITWKFSEEKTVGQYANGDYWVLGPVTITEITPHIRVGGEEGVGSTEYATDYLRHITDGDDVLNGWQVNPFPFEFDSFPDKKALQGFDTRAGSFSKSKLPDLPYLAHPGESIVKSTFMPLSQELIDQGHWNCHRHRPCLNSVAILTVVDEIPADDGATVFRPPYVGTDKPNYSTHDIQNVIPAYPPPPKNSYNQDVTTGPAECLQLLPASPNGPLSGYDGTGTSATTQHE